MSLLQSLIANRESHFAIESILVETSLQGDRPPVHVSSSAALVETKQATDAKEMDSVQVGNQPSPSVVSPTDGSPPESLGRSNSLTEKLLSGT